MADEIDMTGVEPVRRDETLRRVKAVKEYLALPGPSGEAARALAEGLGLKRNQFLTLVRAWAIYGKASALPGAQPRHVILFNESRQHLSPRIEAIIQESIAAVGAGSPMSGIMRRVTETCAREDLRSPAITAVRPRVEATRRQLVGRLPDDGGVVVGRCTIDLPVVDSVGLVGPAVLALAIAAKSGRILAFDAGTAADPGSVTHTLLALVASSRPDGVPAMLTIGLPRSAVRDSIRAAFKAAGLSERVGWPVRAEPMLTVPGLLGGRLAGLAARTPTMRSAYTPPPKLRSRLAAPLARADLEASVGELVDLHNRDGVRHELPYVPLSFGSDTSRTILTLLLSEAVT